MASNETKVCQNCHQQFVIDASDFAFYEKIKVPPPTWCPECRLIRRLVWRNERSMHKIACVKCGRTILTMYSQDSNLPVFCHSCWWGDAWDPLDYGKPYDFQKPFFAQVASLMRQVPKPYQFDVGRCVNTEYANFLKDSKNVYLAFSVVDSEDVYYSRFADESKDVFDSFFVRSCNLIFENIDAFQNYHSLFTLNTIQCLDSFFLLDCVNCRDCFMTCSARNGAYLFRGKQMSKDEYRDALRSIDFGSYETIQKLKEEFLTLRLRAVTRFATLHKITASTGNNLENVKNAVSCFDTYDSENIGYCVRCFKINDCYDIYGSVNGELNYDSMACGTGSQNCKFTIVSLSNLDNQYCDSCYDSSRLFACIGLRNKQYCILNKQYTKEEYEKLIPKIIQHMNEMPYVDKQGRVYKYGEFFPPELSPFYYNETIAQEYFPLTKEQALERGCRWKDPEPRNYQITMKTEDIPDHIKDVNDSILNDIIQCQHNQSCTEQCTQAFKIIPQELQFYQRMNLPLPRLCPNCRHYQRLKQRNPLKLWHRQCMCSLSGSTTKYPKYQNTATHFHGDNPCPNEFETSYALDRPEIVYCEQCYQQEVV